MTRNTALSGCAPGWGWGSPEGCCEPLPLLGAVKLRPAAVPAFAVLPSLAVDVNDPLQKEQLVDSLSFILRTAIAKQKGREYGFITLYNNGNGSYWFKVSRGFSTALVESHSSLETLIEENVEWSKEEESAINKALALVNRLYN